MNIFLYTKLEIDEVITTMFETGITFRKIEDDKLPSKSYFKLIYKTKSNSYLTKIENPIEDIKNLKNVKFILLAKYDSDENKLYKISDNDLIILKEEINSQLKLVKETKRKELIDYFCEKMNFKYIE